MALLYNRISNKELAQMLQKQNHHDIVLQIFPIDVPKILGISYISIRCAQRIWSCIHCIESINGQISVPESNVSFRAALCGRPRPDEVRLNVAVDDDGKSLKVLHEGAR